MCNPYSTHLPVLEVLMEHFPISSVLELGMGNYSTPFFKSCGVRLLSVEPNSSWCSRFASDENHSIVNMPLLDFAIKNEARYDLAFIDGNPAYERSECVVALLNKANIIVAHDTEPESDWNYSYNKIKLPEGFVRLDYTESIPWTSVFTNDQKVIAKLEELQRENES